MGLSNQGCTYPRLPRNSLVSFLGKHQNWLVVKFVHTKTGKVQHYSVILIICIRLVNWCNPQFFMNAKRIHENRFRGQGNKPVIQLQFVRITNVIPKQAGTTRGSILSMRLKRHWSWTLGYTAPTTNAAHFDPICTSERHWRHQNGVLLRGEHSFWDRQCVYKHVAQKPQIHTPYQPWNGDPFKPNINRTWFERWTSPKALPIRTSN